MTYTVTLLPSQIQFSVEAGQTVLDAALNQHISFPHRCQVGACTACLCKKVSGEVEYDLAPLLTEQEQSLGWIFPCLAFATSDLVLTFDE
jgi:ferredoxin